MPTQFDLWASKLITDGPVGPWVAAACLFGWFISRFCWFWADQLVLDRNVWDAALCQTCGQPLPMNWESIASLGLWPGTRCDACRVARPRRWLASLGVALFFGVFAWSVGKLQCQSLTEGGSIDWIHWRILYHLILLSLLLVATVVDFRVYLIPDSITVTGILVGIAGAVWFGNLQLIPVWIDANQEVPRLAGPFIPLWIKQHPHLHGLAWSLTGLVTGAGITWLVREISSRILGQEAMGFGDITLMAMIGSFVGWQPILMIFALAPPCAIIIAITSRFITGKTYIPYGPYLSAATVVVLFTWRWIWTPLKYLYGHPPTVGTLVGGALLAMSVLLGAIRAFRAIPVQRADTPQN